MGACRLTAFTRLGAGVWDWEPFIWLDDSARILWMALYTAAAARRNAPGLWQGGIPTMADASHQHADLVISALDRLLERDMVEYDPKTRVLRLCMLPDAGEYPANGKVILSWWTRFRSLPECGVRDAHVPTLRWIIDTGARLSGKGVTPSHQSAWQETFGTVPIPAPRRRGVRRLADSDTSTQAQPSLFTGPAVPSYAPSVPSGYGMPICGESSYPQVPVESVDNSASLRQMNQIRGPETVSDTVWDTNRIPDPGSRIPDLVSLSGEGGSGGGLSSGKPALSLVPPYTALEVLRELAKGNWDPACDRSHQDALSAMIPVWAALGVGLADFALLGEYNAHKQRRWSARLLMGCDILAELDCAKKTLQWRDAQLDGLRHKLV